MPACSPARSLVTGGARRGVTGAQTQRGDPDGGRQLMHDLILPTQSVLCIRTACSNWWCVSVTKWATAVTLKSPVALNGSLPPSPAEFGMCFLADACRFVLPLHLPLPGTWEGMTSSSVLVTCCLRASFHSLSLFFSLSFGVAFIHFFFRQLQKCSCKLTTL